MLLILLLNGAASATAGSLAVVLGRYGGRGFAGGPAVATSAAVQASNWHWRQQIHPLPAVANSKDATGIVYLQYVLHCTERRLMRTSCELTPRVLL
jgi:hypothetical protein|eukprot:COSAG06_NODE_83_length_25105_cov_69.740913_16_plen_96_part_00